MAPFRLLAPQCLSCVIGGLAPPADDMKYLIQFSQQHESFWLPELDTLLELNGVDPVAAYDHDTAWAIVSRGHKVRG